MRRTIATAGAIMLGVLAFTPGAAIAAPADPPNKAAVQKPAGPNGISLATRTKPGAKPKGPNPFLANLPDETKADYAGWRAYLKKQAAAKANEKLKKQAKAGAATPLVFDEDEPDGTRGSNETPANAQPLNGFGTAKKQNPKARVLGTLNPETVTAEAVPANAEDDGAIPLAGNTGIGTERAGVQTDSVIGDGPHGSAGTKTGDFDFYALEGVAGKAVTARTKTEAGGNLDTFLLLYDAAGTVVAFNDDFEATSFDSNLAFEVKTAGTYYLAVASFASIPTDPFDPASGDGEVSEDTEGPYHVTIAQGDIDNDFFAVNLRPGDVLGASVKGAATKITVYDTDPREVHGSDQDATSIYPPKSPLPGGGNAVTDYVATKAGWHYVGVGGGSGDYDITIEAYRPALEGKNKVQTLFLDFDGARVNTGIWGGPGQRDLSPFASFLGKWGLARADEGQLIDAVTAGVQESIDADLAASGLNDRFQVKVVNSKDSPDLWGKKNVSRIIVGGTIDESGIGTIGIAQSIDPGNFETQESALVLLDVLSDPAGGAPSLNTYLTPASNRLAFVGQAVANVTAHEAGHFFGNWHTDNQSPVVNLQDSGGANYQNLYGVGPDNVGGTADDADVDFVQDAFAPAEGFLGVEDTLGRLVFGLTS